MMPAMMNENMNISRLPPRPATMPSALVASSPILGCMVLTSAGRSACACDQSACAFSPTNGQEATLSDGAGTWSVLSRTLWTRPWTESPNWLASMIVGVMMTATASSTISVDASPCLPPIRAASIWCSG